MATRSENPRLRNPEEELEVESCDNDEEGFNCHEAELNPEEALELAANGIEINHQLQFDLGASNETKPNMVEDGDRASAEPHQDVKQLSKARFDPTLSQKRRRELTLDWQRKYDSLSS